MSASQKHGGWCQREAFGCQTIPTFNRSNSLAGRFSAGRRSGWARWRWPGCCSRSVLAGAAAPRGRRAIAGAVNPLHFAPKAKRVIFLCMAGGPSQFGTVRRKAQARRDARPADARVVHQGPADRPAAESEGAAVLRPAGDVQPATANRARRSAITCRTSAASPTTSASSARCRPSRSITTRPTRS